MFEFDFALSDYNQAFEIDPKDCSVKVRLSAVYNELGLLSYADKRYVQAFEYFDLAIQCNPKVAVYYTSRARARYMLEVCGTDQYGPIEHIFLQNPQIKIPFLHM
jgi:tetratricopeptide (TPR) repeat protein